MRFTARRLALAASLVALLVSATPAAAITNGQLDDGAHPYVGQLFFYVPDVAGLAVHRSWALVQLLGHADQPDDRAHGRPLHVPDGHDGVATTEAGGFGGNDTWFSFDRRARLHGHRRGAVHPRRQRRPLRPLRDTLTLTTAGIRGTAYPHPRLRQRRVLSPRRRRRHPRRAVRLPTLRHARRASTTSTSSRGRPRRRRCSRRWATA